MALTFIGNKEGSLWHLAVFSAFTYLNCREYSLGIFNFSPFAKKEIYMQFLWMNGYVSSMFLQLLIKKFNKKKNSSLFYFYSQYCWSLLPYFSHLLSICAPSGFGCPILCTGVLIVITVDCAMRCVNQSDRVKIQSWHTAFTSLQKLPEQGPLCRITVCV